MTPSPDTGEVRLVLPWPDKLLSPNARVHWAPKSRAVKQARVTGYILTRAEMKAKPDWQAARVAMTFFPPDKRRRDRDNIIASLKAATDGIADALGIDDSRFAVTYRMGSPVKGGAVHVTIARAV